MKSGRNPPARRFGGVWAPMALLLLANLAVGFLLAPHYGQSTDEEENIRYARASLESYSHPESPYRDPAREDKGPFYLMVWTKAGEALGGAVPGWSFADGRHFVNFLAFQLALISIYALAVRFTRPMVALAGVVLFEAQPVFFGHAFINQKDTALMGLFAAALVLGISMVDRFAVGVEELAARRELSPASSGEILEQGWSANRPGALRAGAIAAGLALILPVGRWVFDAPLQAAIDRIVRDAYFGQSWAPINELFARVAQNVATLAPEAYVLRAVRLTNLATAGASFALLMIAIVVGLRLWPGAHRRFWPAVVRELRDGPRMPIPWAILPAAIVLGMGLAVRSIAGFAAGLVLFYGLARAGPRTALLLALYAGGAGLVAYLLWPQLWGSPFAMITSSLDRTVQFPQSHRILFEGVILRSDSLPGWYLPRVMAIQLTLPALGLILPGMALMTRSLMERGAKTALAAVLLLWPVVPFLAVVVFRVPIYGYFRHVLFIMPPLFVAAALAMEQGWRLLRRAPWIGPLLGTAILLPGLVAIVRLYPYEYGYFNEWVGGVRGARGRFIPDYWCTSLREAMEYVNDLAPPSAGIAVAGPEWIAQAYAREDLRVRDDSKMASDADFQPWAILACNLATVDPAFFPDAPVLLTVERDGVPLAIVKSLATPVPEGPGGD